MPRSSQHSRHRVAIAAGAAVLGMFVLVSALSCTAGRRCVLPSVFRAQSSTLTPDFAVNTRLQEMVNALDLTDTMRYVLQKKRTEITSPDTYLEYLEVENEAEKYSEIKTPVQDGSSPLVLEVIAHGKIFNGYPFAYARMDVGGVPVLLSVLKNGNSWWIHLYYFEDQKWIKIEDPDTQLPWGTDEIASAYEAVAHVTDAQKEEYGNNNERETDVLQNEEITSESLQQFAADHPSEMDTTLSDFSAYLTLYEEIFG